MVWQSPYANDYISIGCFCPSAQIKIFITSNNSFPSTNSSIQCHVGTQQAQFMSFLIQRNTVVISGASETMGRETQKRKQNVNQERLVRHRGTCVIPETGNLRPSDGEFKSCLGYAEEKKQRRELFTFPSNSIISDISITLSCLGALGELDWRRAKTESDPLDQWFSTCGPYCISDIYIPTHNSSKNYNYEVATEEFYGCESAQHEELC